MSGSFDVFVADATQDDLNKIHEQYTDATQRGIAAGKLQEELEQVDVFSPFFIEGAVDPPQPIISPLPIPTETDKDSTPDDGISSMGIVFIVGACGIALGLGITAFQYGRREWKAKLAKNDLMSEHPTKYVDTTEPWDGDDDIAGKRASKVSALRMSGIGDNADGGKNTNRYKSQVESLVKKNCPDQTENIATMMHQFEGREDELFATLYNVGGGSTVGGATTIVPEEVSTDRDVESVISGLSRPRHSQMQAKQHPLITGKILDEDEVHQDPPAETASEVNPVTMSRTSSIEELQPVTVSLTSSADQAGASKHFLNEGPLVDDDDLLGPSSLPVGDDPGNITGMQDAGTQ